MKLTPRETDCLNIIQKHIKTKGYFPTHAYIASQFEPSPLDRKSATKLIKILKEKGYIEKTDRYGLYQLSTVIPKE
jgi:Mn-dependent DtxR family transcriptional regulator